MPNERKHRDVRVYLRHLCRQALEAQLDLADLSAADLQRFASDPYYARVGEDLVDGVEHVPGYWFRKGVDLQAWRTSEMFGALTLHSCLLESDLPTDRLIVVFRSIEPALPARQEWIVARARSALRALDGEATPGDVEL